MIAIELCLLTNNSGRKGMCDSARKNVEIGEPRIDRPGQGSADGAAKNNIGASTTNRQDAEEPAMYSSHQQATCENEDIHDIEA